MKGLTNKTKRHTTIYTSILLLALVHLSLITTAQYGNRWEKLPGSAKDIGTGADGSVWAIGTNTVGNPRDFGIYRWTGANWEGIDGGGVRIDVDRKGKPWIVNSAGEIYRGLENRWEKMPGSAKDIGIGADGSVWIIGTNQVGRSRDFGVYRWSGSSWENIDGGGVRIDVDRRGNPWIVNSMGEIYRRVNNKWEKLPGSARDIGIGADGSIWTIGTNESGYAQNYAVYKWTGNSWQGIDGSGVQISVDRFGSAWIVNSMGNIYRRR